jgi:hypothetical protein
MPAPGHDAALNHGANKALRRKLLTFPPTNNQTRRGRVTPRRYLYRMTAQWLVNGGGPQFPLYKLYAWGAGAWPYALT